MANMVKAANGGPVAVRSARTPVQSLFDSLFDSFERFPELAAQRRVLNTLMSRLPDGAGFVPNVEIAEKDGSYIVRVALPGFKKEDIGVEIAGNELTISGSYERKITDEKTRYSEMQQASFTRTIALPQDIDEEKTDARFEDGVLVITAPPSTPISARKVNVK